MKTAVLSALAALPILAQTPVIRTESRLVLVDTVVTDKQGQPIGDLAAGDFRLWEDGREQPVRNASFGSPGQPSYVVLLFDNPTLDAAAGSRVREAAARFVDANTGPGHWVAIADFGATLRTSQNFISNTERLKRVLRETHPLPGTAARGVGTFGGPMAGTLGPGRGGPGTQLGQMAEAGERDLSALGLALRQLAQNLANVPGRKTVVLFTSGVPVVSQGSNALTPAIGTCNRWNVSVYPVVAAEADLAGPFYDLAKNTGGYVSANSHDLDRELERLRREKNGYYTLSYVPAETPDGSCHTLRVKVGRSGAEVRARNLYCNVKAVDLLAGTAVEKELEAHAAGSQPGNLAASFQSAFFYTEPNLARLRLAMEIPTKGLQFTKVKGKPQAEMQILAIAIQPDGVEAARFSDSVKLDAPQEALHYEGQFEIASGKYTLMVVLATGGENFSKLDRPLLIEPYDGKAVALSGLALSKDIRPAADPSQMREAQLFDGVAPLIFQSLRLVPSGENWFRKGDGAAIYGEVYEALPPAGNPPPVELRLRLVDLSSGTAISAGSTKLDGYRPGEFAALPFALKLDSLPQGRYRAELEAVGSAITRALEFEVR